MILRKNKTNIFFQVVIACSLAGCSAKILKKENSEQLLKSDEYDKAVSVSNVEVLTPAGKYVSVTPEEYRELYKRKKHRRIIRYLAPGIVAKLTKKKEVTEEIAPAQPGLAQHLPDFEDGENFNGRRPINDPFRVGEQTTFEVSYFGVVAGELTMKVLPFVFVNGRKSYHFAASGQTASVFEMFYAVNDWLETFVDYDNMIPMSYALHVKESKQLRETRCFFNWQKLVASFWDKRITKEDGVEEKKYDWNILEYSQNVFSGPFYLRAFKLVPGKKIVYRIAHEKENILMTAEVLRREKLETPIGTFDTIVLQPHIQIDGAFKPIGDIFLWMTDDDRHFILRIESKIKIGKIIASVKALQKGSEEAPAADKPPEKVEGK